MRIRSAAVLLTIALAAVACSSAPIMNVNEAPVTSTSGKNLSKAEVRAAILSAGSSLGWLMKDEGPDTIIGTLNLRRHVAVVEIPYSTQAYSIKYRSSVNLEEENGQIHKNYNSWVQNLTRRINTNLATGS